jgi:hypothetical protein
MGLMTLRNNLIKELLLIPNKGGNESDLYITKEEFDVFYKQYLFDNIKGVSLGEAFCEKYKINNYVLLIAESNEFAKKHIETFYIKQ